MINEPRSYAFNNMDCYVFIGDSHATGGVAQKADVTGGYPSAYSTVSPKTKILFKDDRTSESATLRWLDYDSDDNRFPGYGAVSNNIPSIGFDDSFLSYMRDNHKKNIGLVKWALGGTGLLNEWRVGRDGGNPDGSMWWSFADYYAPKGLGKSKDVGFYNPSVKAVIVCLGTNDCANGVWNETNFINGIQSLVKQLRDIFGQPTLPVYWLQVRSDLYLSGLGDYPQINIDACRAAISGAANITVLDYEAQTATVDTVHYDADSNEYIGLQIAQLF